MLAEGRCPTFFGSLNEGRRGDCREASNTQQDPRPPAGTISQGQEGKLACLEVKMVGKPYALVGQVRFDEGGQDFGLGTTLNGHEAGNGGYSQGLSLKKVEPVLYSTVLLRRPNRCVSTIFGQVLPYASCISLK